MSRSPLLLALVGLAAAADAQTVLEPGHPDLALDALTLGESHRVFYVDGRDVGASTRTDAVADGVITIEAETTVEGAPRTRRTVRLAWPSLRPISSRVVTGRDLDEVAFDGPAVTGRFVPDGGAGVPLDLELDRPAFPVGTAELVARALPLEPGYTAVVPTFTAEDRLREVTLTSVGPDSTTLADGTAVAAWAVDMARPGRYGPTTRRLFLDPDSRDVVAIRAETPAAALLVEAVDAGAFAARAAARAAGEPLRPGSHRLATDALRGGRRSFVLRVAAPAALSGDLATVAATWTVGDETATLATTSESNTGEVTVETAVVAVPSLRPLRETRVVAGDLTARAYVDGGVTETTAAGVATRAFDAPVFGASTWLLWEVARLLPLEAGRQFSYRMDGPGGAVGVQMTVEGPSELDGRPVWTVAAAGPEAPARVSFDPETRELVRIELRAAPPLVLHLVPAEG